LKEEILVWKNSYKNLLIIYGKPLVEGAKEALADKFNKLKKKFQKHRRTINLFIKNNIYRNHEIIEVYVQIWKKIDARLDRNR
jgi:hypothetical protein